MHIRSACNASFALTSAFKFDHNNYVFTAIIAGIATIVIRELKVAARFLTNIVPYMTLTWMIFATAATCMNLDGVANAFSMTFRYAFDIPTLIDRGLSTLSPPA